MSEQPVSNSLNNLPSDLSSDLSNGAAAAAAEAEEFSLLEMMELLSDICLVDSLVFLQTLSEHSDMPDGCIEAMMSDITWLKLSTAFGRRFRQIH